MWLCTCEGVGMFTNDIQIVYKLYTKYIQTGKCIFISKLLSLNDSLLAWLFLTGSTINRAEQIFVLF